MVLGHGVDVLVDLAGSLAEVHDGLAADAVDVGHPAMHGLPLDAQLHAEAVAQLGGVRGLQAVRSEWTLICATHNMLKRWRHGETLVLT